MDLPEDAGEPIGMSVAGTAKWFCAVVATTDSYRFPSTSAVKTSENEILFHTALPSTKAKCYSNVASAAAAVLTVPTLEAKVYFVEPLQSHLQCVSRLVELQLAVAVRAGATMPPIEAGLPMLGALWGNHPWMPTRVGFLEMCDGAELDEMISFVASLLPVGALIQVTGGLKSCHHPFALEEVWCAAESSVQGPGAAVPPLQASQQVMHIEAAMLVGRLDDFPWMHITGSTAPPPNSEGGLNMSIDTSRLCVRPAHSSIREDFLAWFGKQYSHLTPESVNEILVFLAGAWPALRSRSTPNERSDLLSMPERESVRKEFVDYSLRRLRGLVHRAFGDDTAMCSAALHDDLWSARPDTEWGRPATDQPDWSGDSEESSNEDYWSGDSG